MDETEKRQYLDFAVQVAQEAGAIMKKYFRSDQKSTIWKEDDTPVTIADHEINSLVIERVRQRFPEHGIIGEEESHSADQDYVWVVDPIDGTALFDLGMPNSTFCLALIYKDEVQVSAVLDPQSDRLFSAIKDQGSFCGDKKLSCQDLGDVKNRYIFMPFGSREQPGLYKNLANELSEQDCKILFVPSFNYLSTLVVEGAGLACLMAYGSPWDAAAISLIASEAGYMVSDIDGQERSYRGWGKGIIVAHPVIYEQLIKGLKSAHSWD